MLTQRNPGAPSTKVAMDWHNSFSSSTMDTVIMMTFFYSYDISQIRSSLSGTSAKHTRRGIFSQAPAIGGEFLEAPGKLLMVLKLFQACCKEIIYSLYRSVLGKPSQILVERRKHE